MANIFFKSHHFIVHFPFALICALLFAYFNKSIDPVKKKKLFKIFSGLLSLTSLYLCASGIGLALTVYQLRPMHFVHASLGISIYLLSSYFFFYQENKWLQKMIQFSFGAVVLTVLTGAVSTVQWNYFLPDKKGYYAENVKHLGSLLPILEKKCLKCHNNEIAGGDVNFKDPDQIKKLIHPYQIKDSRLMQIVNKPTTHRMPLNDGKLSEEEITELRTWLSDVTEIHNSIAKREPMSSDVSNKSHVGVHIEDYITSKTDLQKMQHWTFRKFKKPNLPEVKNKQYINNEIDQFVVYELEKKGNFKIEEIPTSVLARRQSQVLTGLLPDLSDVKALDSVNKNEVYKKLQKKYIDSVHFGENLAVYWMDLVAFADDNGPDGEHKEEIVGMTFRDYIIKALNDNPHFSKLIREQIQPRRSDPKNKKSYIFTSITNNTPDQFIPAISVDTALDTIYGFSLGLEMRCARCHDHPSDPISNEQYYSLAAVYKDEFGGFDPYARVVRSKVLPPPRFLPMYEGADAKKPYQKISDLGEWLTDTEKGVGYFSARVFVDHMWRFVYGKGIVKTAGVFGVTTPPPLYLDLLNWLTYDFIEHGGSIKYLIEKMTSSQVFKSRITFANIDKPMYQVYRSRLQSTENIRDNLLKVANILDAKTTDWTRGVMFDHHALQPKPMQNLRTVYFLRSRFEGFDKNMFDHHFGFPKSMQSTFERQNYLDIGGELFFITKDYLDVVFSGIAEGLPQAHNKYSEDFVNQTYEHILSRRATPEELIIWQSYFNKGIDFKSSQQGFFRVLLSSSEFLFIN